METPTTPPRNNKLPCFSAVDSEHDFLIKKAELGKNGENLAMIMNYKGKLWIFSHNSERLL